MDSEPTHHARVRDPAGAVRRGAYDPDTGQVEAGGRRYDPASDDSTLLAPCEPTKVVCVGRNYADHADETGSDVPDRPLLFLKPPSAVAAPGGTVEVPTGVAGNRVEQEAELGVVVGDQCRNLDADDAMDAVAGFTCVNDLSNRDDQRAESQWVRGKAFDGACPVGPAVAAPEAVPADAAVRASVNGDRRQDGSRADMVFDVPALLAEITRYLTLEPGDVVATGTPEGVGPLADGDRVAVTVEGVGTLEHAVRMP